MAWVAAGGQRHVEYLEEVDAAYQQYLSACAAQRAARGLLADLLEQDAHLVLAHRILLDRVTDGSPSASSQHLESAAVLEDREQVNDDTVPVAVVGLPVVGQVPGDKAQLHGHERFPSLVRRQGAAVLTLTVHWLAGWGNRFPLGVGGRR